MTCTVHCLQWATSEDKGANNNQGTLKSQQSVVEIPCVEVDLPPIASKADKGKLVDEGWTLKEGGMNKMGTVQSKLRKTKSLSLTCATSFTAAEMPDWTIHSNDLYGEGKSPKFQDTPPMVETIPEDSRFSTAVSLPLSYPEMGETLDIQKLSDALFRQVARLQGCSPRFDDVVTGYPSLP